MAASTSSASRGPASNNCGRGRAEQGGSTITQQLARLSVPDAGEDVSAASCRKSCWPCGSSATFTKDEILELYLNKAYFGDGLYGVEAASLGYFGKHAAELDVAEAALIAGLVKSPSTYAPTANPERALARRNLVLRADARRGSIDRDTFEAGREQRRRRSTTRCAARKPTGSTSRRRSGSSSWSGSAGSACTTKA